MTKLNQIIAIEKGVKARAQHDLTEAYRLVQREPLLNGISRTYQPRDDDGDQLPPESTLAQLNVEDALKAVANSLTRLFDVILTKDATNAIARADVRVDDEVILADVPVTYLLFLEKQLTDLHTFVAKLPVLDPAKSWSHNATSGWWQTEPVKTTRTKKVPRNHVKAEATQHHPAQVDVYHEDVIVGDWTTILYSGALPADRVSTLLARVEALGTAVKFAREEANNATVTDRQAGRVIFDYLFGE